MTTYRVVWEYETDADSFEDAARKAREVQLDPTNIASVFTVTNDKNETRMVDLLEEQLRKAQP